jgi:hypothetical protein
MRAFVDTFGSWVVLKLPPSAQLGPEMERLMHLYPFEKCGTEWQQHFRLTCKSAEQQEDYRKAAQFMADSWNTGKREYCKPILQPKQKVQHG